jgi:hypothetical protein
MLYRGLADFYEPFAAPSGPASQTAAHTVKFRLKQETKRAHMLAFTVRVTSNAAAMTGAAWGGFAAIVKEIRVRINDVLGSRNCVAVSGIGALSYWRQVNGGLDSLTVDAYGSAGFAVSTTYEITYVIPLRQPQIAEPYGNILSLPLSQNWLREDPIVEVDFHDIGAAGTVFTTNPPAYTSTNTFELAVYYHNVPETTPYIPSELRSDTFAPTSVSGPAYEFPSSGWLTGFLVQGLSGDFGNAVTRSTTFSSEGQLRLEYGRDIIRRQKPRHQRVLNETSMNNFPSLAASNIASSFLTSRQWPHELMFDFLNDGPGTAPFSINSVLGLDTQLMGGDKLRFILNDAASTSIRAHITHHRLLPRKPEDLQILAAQVGA